MTAALGGFTGKASGGSVSAGSPYWSGERGPEPILRGDVWLRSTRIGQVGGGTVVYIIDARGAHPGAERDIVLALKQTEDRAVGRAIAITRENGLRGRG